MSLLHIPEFIDWLVLAIVLLMMFHARAGGGKYS